MIVTLFKLLNKLLKIFRGEPQQQPEEEKPEVEERRRNRNRKRPDDRPDGGQGERRQRRQDVRRRRPQRNQEKYETEQVIPSAKRLEFGSLRKNKLCCSSSCLRTTKR